MEIRRVKLGELVPYENNPRNNDKAVEAVAESIYQCGYCSPIVVDEDYVILAGHTRLKALQLLEWNEAEVCIKRGLSEEQKRKYRILDNKTNELSAWDIAKLEQELQGLDFGDFDFGFDASVLADTDNGEVVEDVIPVEAEKRCKYGDIWQLGEHRLMCGSSIDQNDVLRLMDGKLADVVFTDPPYGVSFKGGREETKEKYGIRPIANDEKTGKELTEFLSCFIRLLQYKQGASIYICYPWASQQEFTEAIKQNGLDIKNCIIWDKIQFGLNGRKGYRPQYEMIYFCCKDDYTWYGDMGQSNIWSISREINRKEQGGHPTPKPVELVARALKNSSKKGDLCVDAFAGSGSTLIACEQIGRICYTMELDEKYCDVVLQRWENLTGRKAVLING